MPKGTEHPAARPFVVRDCERLNCLKARTYAMKLQEAGVEVTLKRFDGLGHGCGEMDVLLPGIASAYGAAVADFLRRTFSTATV
jgi:acetyl esterase/lipase